MTSADVLNNTITIAIAFRENSARGLGFIESSRVAASILSSPASTIKTWSPTRISVLQCWLICALRFICALSALPVAMLTLLGGGEVVLGVGCVQWCTRADQFCPCASNNNLLLVDLKSCCFCQFMLKLLPDPVATYQLRTVKSLVVDF